MLSERIRGKVETDVPMARHTTWMVGGNADVVVCPLNIAELREVVLLAESMEVPLLVVGAGSNLLVRDGGIRGIVVNLTKGLRKLERLDNSMLCCEAGVSLACLLSYAADLGLGGIEFLSGIPGTVGGALRMNAGAFGREMKDVVRDISFMNRDGQTVTVPRERLSFSYRNLYVKDSDTITGCTLALEKRKREEIRDRMKRFAIKRGENQPLGMPTAGSVFKNPPGDFAGRLIEEAGLKGVKIGMARVSERHANFIENLGGGKAADIIALMDMIREKVYMKSGITLDPEVMIVGEEFPPGFRVEH